MDQEEIYYKPSIEEFHVGLEYLCRPKTFMTPSEYPYTKSVWLGNNSLITEFECSDLRVKFLNDDDLLELGWKTAHSPSYVIDDQSILLHSIGEEPKWFNLEKDGELIVITVCTIYNDVSGNWTQESVFKGRIKNKSELKRLMQQLEIQ